MTTIFHPASERGHVNFGWLDSHHSFSFGHWYDPNRINFGALRVLNDDIVNGGGGFGTHPHDNMEIVSIPIYGALKHKDSTGTDGVINSGDVQIMSAGSGIRHSEMNASGDKSTNFLQLWILPKEENIKPRYDQKTFDAAKRLNNWQIVVSPDAADNAVWINQDARFSLLTLDAGKSIEYQNRFSGNGVYVFLIDGKAEAGGQALSKRDAVGISGTDSFSITAQEQSAILAIEVPMLNLLN